MQELEKRIGLLRLLLADVENKRAQLADLDKQYKAQLNRIVEFVVYRDGDLSSALSLMSEVRGKLDEVERTTEHLELVANKASVELEVLVLTKRVSEARSQLVELEERQRELAARLSSLPEGEDSGVFGLEQHHVDDIRSINDEVAEVSVEIARLQNLISEASERAARTIQSTKGKRSEQAARKESQ